MDLSVWGRQVSITSPLLNEISVVPNPYSVESDYNESPGEHRLYFTRLPNQCTLSIYTITGEKVYSVIHDEIYRGNYFWNLKNEQNQLIAPGLYIYVVEAEDETLTGKFAVIR